MKRLPKLLLHFSAGLLVPNLHAGDCMTECMNRLGCFSGGMGTQNCGYNNSHGFEMCGIQCKGVNTQAFGAIAYSLKEKVFGWSNDKPDQATAERAAIQFCAKSGGSKCVIEASFHNTCGAISTDGKDVFWGTHGSKYSAEQRALAECSKPGKKCTVESSVCSSPGANAGSSLPSTPPQPRATSWGAIAYSSAEMSAGYSQGKPDRAAAEKEAM